MEPNATNSSIDAGEAGAEGLVDRRLHRRAVEAAIWGMPAVNYELMRSVLSPDQPHQFGY